MPIIDGLAEYALISAFRDSRFRRIDKSELEMLECGYVLRFSSILVLASTCAPFPKSIFKEIVLAIEY
jgi:hypothetical protein